MSGFARNSLLFHGGFGGKRKKNRNDGSSRKNRGVGGGSNKSANPIQTPLRSNVVHTFNGNVHPDDTANGKQLLASETDATRHVQSVPPPPYTHVQNPRMTSHHEPDFDNGCLSQLTMSQFSNGSQDYSSRSSSSQPSGSYQHNIHSVSSNCSTAAESQGSYPNNHFATNRSPPPTNGVGNSWSKPRSSGGSVGGQSRVFPGQGLNPSQNSVGPPSRWNFAQASRSLQPAATPARRSIHSIAATPRVWMKNLLKPPFRVSLRSHEASQTDAPRVVDKTPPTEARDDEATKTSHRSTTSCADEEASKPPKAKSSAISPGSITQTRFETHDLASREAKVKEEREALEKLSSSVAGQMERFQALAKETESQLEQQRATEENMKQQQAALEALSSSVATQIEKLKELKNATDTKPAEIQELADKVTESKLAVLQERADAAVARINKVEEEARANITERQLCRTDLNLTSPQLHMLQAILPAIRNAASHAATELAQKEAQNAINDIEKLAITPYERHTKDGDPKVRNQKTLAAQDSPTKTTPILELTDSPAQPKARRSFSTIKVRVKSTPAQPTKDTPEPASDDEDHALTAVVPDPVGSSFIPQFLRAAGALVVEKVSGISPPRTRSGKRRLEPSRPVTRRSKRKKLNSGDKAKSEDGITTAPTEMAAEKDNATPITRDVFLLDSPSEKPALPLALVQKTTKKATTKPHKGARRGKRSKTSQPRAVLKPLNICITPPRRTQTSELSVKDDGRDVTDEDWGCGPSRSLFSSPVVELSAAKKPDKVNRIPASSTARFKVSMKSSRKRKKSRTDKKNRGSMTAIGRDYVDFSFM